MLSCQPPSCPLRDTCLFLPVIAVCGRDPQSVDTGEMFARLLAFGWGAVGPDWAVGLGTEAGTLSFTEPGRAS